MASRYRYLMRSLLLCLLAGAVVLSAGCGCSSKSAGPPTPGPGGCAKPPPSITHLPWDGVDKYNRRWYEREYYRHSDARERHVSYCDEDIIHEDWRTAASFDESMDHNRVLKGAGDGLPSWGQLAFLPVAPAGAEIQLSDTAYAVYALGPVSWYDRPVFVELEWVHEPAWEDCWIGVRYLEGLDYCWYWYRPDRAWRVELLELDKLRASRWDRSTYVVVLITGNERCVLKEIALRQRRWWY